ncbi:hypothetical protein L218DRAFT_956969 [Marasmius fiardii PR-910]|nr:hypothetical protein L218DRAFT_956969 [Marasmius fiardii PR-910]
MTSRTIAVDRKPGPSTLTSRPKPIRQRVVEKPVSPALQEQNAQGHNNEERAVDYELSTAAMELRNQVLEVYNSIEGNTADGRWTVIARLLNPPCTRGRYGVWFPPLSETRRDMTVEGIMEMGDEEVTGVVGASSRSIPPSAHESKAARLKEKVEKWQMDVAVEAEEKASSRTVTKGKTVEKKVVETSVTPQVGVTHPSSLGFHAQKTLPSQLKAKMKPSKSDEKRPVNDQFSDHAYPPETTSKSPVSHRKAISEIPENDFLPPSFSSSQVQHSTPFRKPTLLRRAPSPIPHADISAPDIHAEPPLTSSPFTNGLQTSPIPAFKTANPIKSSPKPPMSNLGLSCSLPAFGSPKVPAPSAEKLFMKAGQLPTTRFEAANPAPLAPLSTKRPGPLSPEGQRPVKQRHIETHDIEEDALMHVPSSPLSSPPVTPQKHREPTLTELLSARKSTSPPKRKARISGTGGLNIRPINEDGLDAEASTRNNAKPTSGPSPHSQAPTNKLETQRTTTTATTIQGRQPGWEDLPAQSEDPHSLPIPEYSNVMDFTSAFGFDITAPPKSTSPIDSAFDKEAVDDAPDSASLPQSSSNHPVFVPDSPALPDFTFDPEAFAPQLASTQQKDVIAGGSKVRGDVFLNSGNREGTDEELMLPSSPKKQKMSPVRGGAARFSSVPVSRSPSKTPSKSQSQFPFGYSSQMDLEGGVDRVSRFLEKDISMVDLEDEDVDEYETAEDRFAVGTKGWMY